MTLVEPLPVRIKFVEAVDTNEGHSESSDVGLLIETLVGRNRKFPI